MKIQRSDKTISPRIKANKLIKKQSCFMKKNFKCLLAVLIPVAALAAETFLSAPPRLPEFMAGYCRGRASSLRSGSYFGGVGCPAQQLVIDPSRMQKLAQDYQAARGKDATREDFMFAAMPEEIFKSILHDGVDPKEMPSDLGLLYWSGYEGGFWLNSIMKSNKGQGMGPAKMIRLLKIPALLYINNMCKQRMELVAKGGRDEKIPVLDRSLGALISSYGYNRGYLLEIMKHPPREYRVPDDFFVCKGLIDCEYGVNDTQNFKSYLTAEREQLNNPDHPYWIEFNKRLSKKLPKAMDQGKDVWKNIMADKEFSPSSYQALLDISAEFLMINETIMLAAVTSIANIDERAMNRVLLADAAFRVWLIGYMVGLGERAD